MQATIPSLKGDGGIQMLTSSAEATYHLDLITKSFSFRAADEKDYKMAILGIMAASWSRAFDTPLNSLAKYVTRPNYIVQSIQPIMSTQYPNFHRC